MNPVSFLLIRSQAAYVGLKDRIHVTLQRNTSLSAKNRALDWRARKMVGTVGFEPTTKGLPATLGFPSRLSAL